MTIHTSAEADLKETMLKVGRDARAAAGDLAVADPALRRMRAISRGPKRRV
jgi:hypothetical protein